MQCAFNIRIAIVLFPFIIAPTLPAAGAAKSAPPAFEKSWRAVDSLMRIGLTQTALDTVIRLHKQAVGSGNPDQIIKTVIFRMRLESFKEEDAFVKALDRLDGEIKTAKFPVTPVLHSMIAECYWHYYENNRWRFYNRTQAVRSDSFDIHTWDFRTIMDKMTTEFEMSLRNPEVLKKTPFTVYNEAIINREIDAQSRPTLFDFLAYRAIDFFSMDADDLTKPASEFALNNEDYLKPFEKFAQIKIATEDTASLKFRALKLLQELIVFHANNNDIDALIDADIQRLSFVRQHAVLPNKDSLYLTALVSLENLTPYSPASAEATYRIALLYHEWADSYVFKYVFKKNEHYRWMNKEALKICGKAIKAFPGSFGAKQCANLSAQITSKSMTFTNESVLVPGKPFKMLVSYKNISKVFLRQIPLAIEDFQRMMETEGDSIAAGLAALKPVKEWSVDVPDPGDFQNHYVEVDAPALPLVHYALLCASDPQFSSPSQAIAYSTTQVSRLSYIERRNISGKQEFLVLDREMGAPLKEVTTKAWSRIYDDKTRAYTIVPKGTYATDKNGLVTIGASINSYQSCVVEFSLSHDHLRASGEYYLYPESVPAKSMTLRTYFFTDRAIYRPGQTIYFKGIMLRADGDRNEIAAKEKTSVRFYNANGQEIGQLALTSNDFGSIHGSFTAPLNALNGLMYITDGHGAAYVSVEEYKRPKFEVIVDPFKGLGKLDETVKFTGRAKAYAGSAIDGAHVKYRVVREARLPIWSCWRPPYWEAETEIAGGATVTNDTGGFAIDFKAIPDPTVPESENPVFTYRVSVDITDIAGETRSSFASISLGYVSLDLDIAVPEHVNKDADSPFAITTTNLSGEFEPTRGTISIYRLKTPSKVLRKRLWQAPDTVIMNETRHASLFPTDLYNEEMDSTKWVKTEKVFEGAFNTQQSKEIRLSHNDHWKQGAYVLEGRAKDPSGREVKDIKYFVLFSEREKSLPFMRTDWFAPLNTKCEPGEKAVFLVGSGYDNAKVLYEVEHKGKIIQKEWLKVSNGQTRIEVPVEEKFRGNFSVDFTFVRDSRCYQHSAVITVPWTNKQLDISFETFRDKLKPGENAEWRLKIAGKNKDKVAAEMVASLYDASLDAFKPQSWDFSIFPSYGATAVWNVWGGFNCQMANCFEDNWNDVPGLPSKEYPALNWFGYGFEGGYPHYGRGHGVLNEEGIPMPAMAAPMAPSTAKSQEKNEDFRSRATKAGALELKQTAEGLRKPKIAGAPQNDLSSIVTRSNLNETAFFYPALLTNEKGEVIVKFQIPEALTKWKMLGFAHTKDLSYGLISKELVTQKDLMVMPHLPRFLREGDRITLTAAVSNLSNKVLAGSGRLMLFDAATMRPVDSLFNNNDVRVNFSIPKGKSAVLTWDLIVPEGLSAVVINIAAKADDFSDGEEHIVPVLSNRMLVTESMPLSLRKKETKRFTFAKLVSGSGNSITLRNHRLTLEFASNPVWYAVQALPYLMEYPYECAEQVFDRFYANSIASYLANSSPRIKAVFDLWRAQSPGALLSNLEKNQELKALMLEETPWVLDGKDESERKKRVALLFDLNKMANERETALSRLKKMQSAGGGWPWFDGMPDDRFITQYIAIGFGRLLHLGVLDPAAGGDLRDMLKRCVRYLDDLIGDDYASLVRCKADLEKKKFGRAARPVFVYAQFF